MPEDDLEDVVLRANVATGWGWGAGRMDVRKRSRGRRRRRRDLSTSLIPSARARRDADATGSRGRTGTASTGAAVAPARRRVLTRSRASRPGVSDAFRFARATVDDGAATAGESVAAIFSSRALPLFFSPPRSGSSARGPTLSLAPRRVVAPATSRARAFPNPSPLLVATPMSRPERRAATSNGLAPTLKITQNISSSRRGALSIVRSLQGLTDRDFARLSVTGFQLSIARRLLVTTH
eukprot:28599-Pelagococcus_subviridis.AAC.2